MKDRRRLAARFDRIESRMKRVLEKYRYSTPSERGGAMVEMAIMLPIIVMAVVSMIDISFLYRDKQIITDAVRQGARTAARSSGICDNETTCDFNPAEGSSLSCFAAGDDISVNELLPSAMADDDRKLGTVEVLAKRSTYRYLKQSGLNPDEWVVTVTNPMPSIQLTAANASPPDVLQIVQVNIERNLAAGSGCILCLANGSGAKPASSARFLLEKECS